MKTINLSNKYLNSIDLSEFDKMLLPKYKYSCQNGGYGFYDKSGIEQYRLLSYLSTLLDGETILDVGSFQGGSAIALSHNKNNNVISVDINYQIDKKIKLPNVMFLEGNILNLKEELIKYKDGFRDYSSGFEYGEEIIHKSKLILYDTVHNGIVERQFHDYLIKSNWSGVCIWDDTKYKSNGNIRKGMSVFWDSIKNEKEDVTKYAHWTGTGIVWYNQDKDINLK